MVFFIVLFFPCFLTLRFASVKWIESPLHTVHCVFVKVKGQGEYRTVSDKGWGKYT